ncbi:FHA domain-containing protein [Cellulomonas sp. H30R-01]|uniref:FHA domain-containing protein n=1 Tax=Cellulomonas sp. H30R-01 TaxID=2704467 RepID=UPI00138D701D|nr:FHA domain-containing protein [Cellulomonas sp. H30R-01]QHT56136.1 FHA domain-containing protein [Cellulomonas sp. H30R-01]
MSVPQYSAGEWTAVVRPGFVALVGPQADADVARALWDAAPQGVLAVLDVLARDGLAALPPFAVASVDGTRVHVAVRGDVDVEVTATDGGVQVLRAGAVRTWSEQVLETVGVLVARADGAPDAPVLPLVEGVAPAGTVRVDVAEVVVPVVEPEVEEPQPATAVDVERPVDDRTPSYGEDTAEPAVEVEPVAVPPVAVTPVVVEPVAAAAEPVADEPAAVEPAPVEPDPEPAVEDEPVASPVALTKDTAQAEVADVVEEPGTPVDDAWEHTVRAPASAAYSLEPQPTEPRYDVVAAAEQFLEQHAQRPGLVDLSPVRPVDQPAVPPASPDDHDGLTILSSDLAAIRDQLPSWAADEVPGPFAVPAAAEPARLVLSTGLVVTLDRAVLLGRAPQVARVTNRELPRLVTVPSPQQDISRTHAEVRVEGDHVLVTDLDSTNGVHVSRPGEGARRLHPGEPSVVATDEVVDLGDGVTFTVERGS